MQAAQGEGEHQQQIRGPLHQRTVCQGAGVAEWRAAMAASAPWPAEPRAGPRRPCGSGGGGDEGRHARPKGICALLECGEPWAPLPPA
ncbi:hypothetical protein BM1_02357 [Bipolaris maydis]|nr:hypothetical protein BM1_02357 [Bipolaris maydis]